MYDTFPGITEYLVPGTILRSPELVHIEDLGLYGTGSYHGLQRSVCLWGSGNLYSVPIYSAS